MSEHTKTPELKPCPFCGNELPQLYSPDGGYHWVASCEHNGCMIRTLPCDSKSDAVNRWNTRTESVNDDLLKALKVAKETIRTWHNINTPPIVAGKMWELYQCSPEMIQVNIALREAEGE